MGATGYSFPPKHSYSMQQPYPPQFQVRGERRTQAGGGHRTSGIIWTGEFQPNWVKMDPDYGDLDGEWGAHERMKWEEDWVWY